RARMRGLGEVERRVHERDAREGLRIVAELPPLEGVELLGEQAELVPEREQALEERARLVEPPLERVVVREPERARKEDPLARRQAVHRGRLVVGGVALDEAVADEVALDR